MFLFIRMGKELLLARRTAYEETFDPPHPATFRSW